MFVIIGPVLIPGMAISPGKGSIRFDVHVHVVFRGKKTLLEATNENVLHTGRCFVAVALQLYCSSHKAPNQKITEQSFGIMYNIPIRCIVSNYTWWRRRRTRVSETQRVDLAIDYQRSVVCKHFTFLCFVLHGVTSTRLSEQGQQEQPGSAYFLRLFKKFLVLCTRAPCPHAPTYLVDLV